MIVFESRAVTVVGNRPTMITGDQRKKVVLSLKTGHRGIAPRGQVTGVHLMKAPKDPRMIDSIKAEAVVENLTNTARESLDRTRADRKRDTQMVIIMDTEKASLPRRVARVGSVGMATEDLPKTVLGSQPMKVDRLGIVPRGQVFAIQLVKPRKARKDHPKITWKRTKT